MLIKKHKSGNEYIRAEDVWVRNFTKKHVKPISISRLYSEDDYNIVLKNEQLNANYPKISSKKLNFENVVIISDGYRFSEKHKFLESLPKDIAVFAVNRALKKWNINRTINAFISNNPYHECMNCLHDKYFPTFVTSSRTNPEFLKKSPNNVLTYSPTQEESFGWNQEDDYHIDDYRNPICAALGLAYRFNAKKILLVCCDDSFEDERDFAVKLDNGLYTYPQHVKSQKIIDANLYWMTHEEGKKVKIGNYSGGIEYVNAEYINTEEQALFFFRDQQEGAQNV